MHERSEVATGDFTGKHLVNDFSEDAVQSLAEVARGVSWARSLFHAALDVISQKYTTLDVVEQECLARRVVAIARSQSRSLVS